MVGRPIYFRRECDKSILVRHGLGSQVQGLGSRSGAAVALFWTMLPLSISMQSDKTMMRLEVVLTFIFISVLAKSEKYVHKIAITNRV